MVSKITPKKTPSKPSLLLRRRPKTSSTSPLKKTSSFAAASFSIRRSLRSCRRRLLKLFSRLPLLSNSSTPKPHRFRRLSPLPSPPPKKTIFLDLDETLVHSTTDPPPESFDFTVHPSINGRAVPFYVLKRPGVDEFLETVAKSFEVIVFTAGIREYASLVLDRLDPKGEMISHRLYRDSCREVEGGRFVKDLSEVGRELDSVVIVDDNPCCYSLQPENGFPVSPFVGGDGGDRELERVKEFLDVVVLFDDVRDAVKYYFSKMGVQKNQDWCSGAT